MSDFEITSCPIAALDGALVVGVERASDGDLKVYLGARYKGIYVAIPPGEHADRIERAWNGTGQHLFMRPVPPPEALFRDA